MIELEGLRSLFPLSFIYIYIYIYIYNKKIEVVCLLIVFNWCYNFFFNYSTMNLLMFIAIFKLVMKI